MFLHSTFFRRQGSKFFPQYSANIHQRQCQIQWKIQTSGSVRCRTFCPGQSVDVLSDILDLLMEVRIIAAHPDRLRKIQRIHADEALCIDGNGAVTGLQSNLVHALGGKQLHLLQLINTMKQLFRNHTSFSLSFSYLLHMILQKLKHF